MSTQITKAPLLESANDLLRRLTTDRPPGNLTEIIGALSDPRVVLQDFRPAGLSLEWEIGELYWRRAGVRPFVRNEVPFLINNDGVLSGLAAALLFANGRESGCRDGPINVVEYGAGSGLFARLFLDAIKELCQEQGTDDYDRLTYYATDASPRTVADWVERGLFKDHGAHAVLAVCNAEQIDRLATIDGGIIALPSLRAAFCNYVLDVLPCALVRRGDDAIEELCVRTLLTADAALIAERTPLSPDEILALALSGNPAERELLEPLMALFEYETRFSPVTRRIPFLDEAVAWGGSAERIILNHGALSLLDRTSAQLDDSGFILINDYGATDAGEQAAHGVCQRFGATSALGICFPLLEHFLKSRQLYVLTAPDDAGRSIHTRLITRRLLPLTEQMFTERFDAAALASYEAPAQQARSAIAAGSYGEALDRYREAIDRQPRNWRLLGEIAEFILFQIKEPSAALELARRAIALNPNLSAWLWNVLGDALWTVERYADAHTAYLEARSIDPDDPRTLLNLSYTLLRLADHSGALEVIARGIACDSSGAYRDRLLVKQQQVIAAIAAAAAREREQALLRLSRLQASGAKTSE